MARLYFAELICKIYFGEINPASFHGWLKLRTILEEQKIIGLLTFRFQNFNFCPTKTDLSGNTVWPQASSFQNSPKWTIFGIFNELLSTHNVNVARFARNVEWDFFCDFQSPCSLLAFIIGLHHSIVAAAEKWTS